MQPEEEQSDHRENRRSQLGHGEIDALIDRGPLHQMIRQPPVRSSHSYSGTAPIETCHAPQMKNWQSIMNASRPIRMGDDFPGSV